MRLSFLSLVDNCKVRTLPPVRRLSLVSYICRIGWKYNERLEMPKVNGTSCNRFQIVCQEEVHFPRGGLHMRKLTLVMGLDHMAG
jgi:hypothetical protein